MSEVQQTHQPWKECVFISTFEVPLRNGLTKPSRVRGNGLRMVNMREIFKYDRLDDDSEMELVPVEENEKVALLSYNDLLFARQSLVESGAGKIAIFKGKLPTVFESHLIRCRINEKIADADFIYHFWKSPFGKGTMSTIVTQTAAAGIKGSVLQTLPIPLPPLDEQRAIASVLCSLDDKIDLLYRQNKTLEAMAETLFRQWFVEEADEGWEEKPLGDYVTVVDNRGKTPPNSSIYTPYPVIEVNALGKNDRLVDYSVIKKYVDEDTHKNWYRNKLKKYDILIATVGSIGGISMYIVEIGNIAQNVIGLHAETISPFYLYQIIKYKNNELMQMDIGGVQPSIKVPHLLSMHIIIPPKEFQILFDVQMQNILSKMECNYIQIRTIEKLRDTLLPKLMSGEVRIEI
jgi:type I restriction enzyme S subunit